MHTFFICVWGIMKMGVARVTELTLQIKLSWPKVKNTLFALYRPKLFGLGQSVGNIFSSIIPQ